MRFPYYTKLDNGARFAVPSGHAFVEELATVRWLVVEHNQGKVRMGRILPLSAIRNRDKVKGMALTCKNILRECEKAVQAVTLGDEDSYGVKLEIEDVGGAVAVMNAVPITNPIGVSVKEVILETSAKAVAERLRIAARAGVGLIVNSDGTVQEAAENENPI